MTLKAYSFTRTSETGSTQNCYITFDTLRFSWKPVPAFDVIFNHYSSEAESERKLLRVGKDQLEPVPARQPFVLRLSGNELLAQTLTPIAAGDANTPFLLCFSNRIWQMALDTPFISDFSELDADGNRVERLKSLADLNAVLHEIELS